MSKKSRSKGSSKVRKEKVAQAFPAKIKVVGVGGGGGNVVTRMSISPFRGVEFIAINTDVQDLNSVAARKKIHIGKNLTKGLGTGMNPEMGRQAAEENLDEIAAALEGADMIFITAGMGGGTGSGASPVVAEAARKTGALTVGVVTKPFFFEGSQRMKVAEEAISKLRGNVDALITIPNDKIFSLIDSDTPLLKAFEKIDDILRNAVQGISELITAPGIINVDFADVRMIMAASGTAVVGTGLSGGKERAVAAARTAITSPLLETSIEGARGILFSIAGGRDMRMAEINDAAKCITEAADPACRIIFGAYHDRRLKPGAMRVTVLAAGFSGYAAPSDEGPTTVDLFDVAPQVEVRGSFFDADGDSGRSQFEPIHEKAAQHASPKPEEKRAHDHGTKEGGHKTQAQEAGDDKWDIPTFLRKGG